jgi:hypothetical protein
MGTSASAGDCDALAKRVTEASPVAVAEAFTALAACDADQAKKVAAKAIPRVVEARDAADAMAAAIRVGAVAPVRGWLADQEPDARSRTIARIGKKCAQAPEIADFFADAAGEIGATFWEERWHRGLADCRYERVQTLLTEAIDGPDVGRGSRNRSGFFALLEVYARNLGAASVPRLSQLLASARDEEEAVFLVSIFADAANVGGSEGTDPEASKAAIAAIEAAAPKLPTKALDRARGTLVSLGAEAAASGLAKHGWSDVYVDGSYTYGVVAIEDITCKNGSKRAVYHVGSFTEPGAMWPDQLKEPLTERVKKLWSFDAASKCKGTSDISVRMSNNPLSADALKAWQDAARGAFDEKFSEAKTFVVAEEGFGY